MKQPASLLAQATLVGLGILAAVCALADDDDDWMPPPLAPPPPGALAAAVDWARENAQPLSGFEPGTGFGDLQGLKAIIGDARFIGFGEGMHDTHEFLAFRNRLFEFLVAEIGVTAIAIETGYSESVAADDYVLGRTEASDAAYTSVFSWAETPSVESKQLLDWMRAHNALKSTTRPLRIYGLDLTGGRSGVFTESRVALDAMLAYIAQVDATRALHLKRVLGPLLPSFNTKGYRALPAQERNALTAGISDAIGAFERDQVEWVHASSPLAYQRAYQHAVVARQLDMNFRVQNDEDSQSQRDAAMARNLLWVGQQEAPQGRVLVFSHNVHIRKGRAPTGFSSLGCYAAALLGKEFVVIGSLFNQGAVGTLGEEVWPMAKSDPSTLNAALLAGAGRPMFYADLRSLPRDGPLGDWVDRGQPLRQDYFEGAPRASFDAIVFIETISPLTPLHAPQ